MKAGKPPAIGRLRHLTRPSLQSARTDVLLILYFVAFVARGFERHIQDGFFASGDNNPNFSDATFFAPLFGFHDNPDLFFVFVFARWIFWLAGIFSLSSNTDLGFEV